MHYRTTYNLGGGHWFHLAGEAAYQQPLPLCMLGQLPPSTSEIEEILFCASVTDFFGLFLSFFGAPAVLLGSYHGPFLKTRTVACPT
jgi:hypothetical protein